MKRIVLILCAALLVIPSCKKDGPDNKKEDEIPQSPAKDVKAVDLGLSVLWADRNIGASSPEDPGHFFAWGETTARKFGAFATPYVFDDCDTPEKLLGENDTAVALWGDGWRMPTKDEILAMSHLSYELKKDEGGKYIGVTVSGNGNSIYIPVADPNASYRSFAIWSSERTADKLWACYFDTFGNGISNARREYAHAVRPVRSK